MENTENKKREPMSPKKKVKIIIASLIGVLVLCVVLIAALNAIDGNSKDDVRETLPPIDEWLLHETYEEEFDIMQYEEYLGLDRNIYLNNKSAGVTQSVSDDDKDLFGEGFSVIYRVIEAIREGDHITYNRYMGADFLKKKDFTQQQIYSITVVPESSGSASEGGATFDEYIFTVTYRIHENNGSYRNTIESDVSRPQIFIVNDSTGEFKVMDIIEQGYKK